MPGIHSAASKSGRCRGTYAVLNVGENGEARKVNLKDDSRPVYIRLADGTVQRLRSVNQIREAEKSGLGPVSCTQLAGEGQRSFHPGNLIHDVVEGTAAHRAGLLAGDEIEAVVLIDPDTGKPQLDKDGRPVRVPSGDMRGLRAVLDENPYGVFDIVARRGGRILTLRMEGQMGRSSVEQGEDAAAASHETWRSEHAEKAGEEPFIVDTPEGPVNINVPFGELPAAYAKSLAAAGRTAVDSAIEHHRRQLGQAGAGRHYSLSQLASAEMAEHIYTAHHSGKEGQAVPFDKAAPEIRAMYQALAKKALHDTAEWGTLHGINAPFGPALADGDRGYVRLGAGVKQVPEESPAGRAGLKEGDRIVGIAGRPGMSLKEIDDTLAQMAEDGIDRSWIVVNRYDNFSGPTPTLVEIPTGKLASLGMTLDAPSPRDGGEIDPSTLVPVPPDFRIMSPDAARAAIDDIRKGGSGHNSRSIYASGRELGDVRLRTLDTHRSAYGKGAEKATAEAAAPLPHILKQQAYRMHEKDQEQIPLAKFAPEGRSPIEAALDWTGTPCRIETPTGNVEARVAAAIMTLAATGVSVADNPEMRARAEYVQRSARLSWSERAATGAAGTGSVYEGLIRTTSTSDSNNIADIARWIASGQSEAIVAKTIEAQRTAEGVIGRPDRWNVERSDKGTVTLSRIEGSSGGESPWGVEQVGHAYGPAVVCQAEHGGSSIVSVAEDLGEEGFARLVEDLHTAERQARREQRAEAARSQAEHAADLRSQAEQAVSEARRRELTASAERAQQLADEKAAAVDGDDQGRQLWDKNQWGFHIGTTVTPLAGRSVLAPEQVAAVVDSHLRGEYQLPPIEPATALGTSELDRDVEAARAISSAVADLIPAQRQWSQVMAATPGYAGLVGAHPDVVHRQGLHLRPRAEEGAGARVGTVLLTNDPHEQAGASASSRMGNRLVVAITGASDPNGQRIVMAQGDQIGETRLGNEPGIPTREAIVAARSSNKGSKGLRIQRLPQGVAAR